MISEEQKMASEQMMACADAIRAFLNIYDAGIEKTIVILDDDPLFLQVIKEQSGDSKHIITISDTKEFAAFVHNHGINKLYIDINLHTGESGIDLVEEMELKNRSAEIVFISETKPTPEQLKKILELGATFLVKDKILNGHF